MYKKICAYVDKFDMLKQGDKVLVGVSGGPDSVCLLHLLLRISGEKGLRLYVVHVNHMLRKEEAEEDACFVRKLAKEYGLDYKEVREKVAKVAAEEHISLEEAGREVRYRAFYALAEEWGCERIAVAHHMDDQAETVLFRLFRGTGLSGLCGMQPVRDKIIRPLLCVDREEIMNYLAENGLSFCNDSSNEEECYSRNVIRRRIIPCAENSVNAGAVRHIAEAAEQLSAANDYTRRQVDKIYEKLTEDGSLLLGPLCRQDEYIQEQVVRRCFQEMAGSLKDVQSGHIREIMHLRDMENGKEISLPYHITAVRQYDRIRFLRSKEAGQQSLSVEIKPGEDMECYFINEKNKNACLRVSWITDTACIREIAGQYEEGFLEDRCSVFPPQIKKIQNSCTKFIDCGTINNDFFLRHPREGDYMQIDERGHRKKLSRLFIDEKLPARERAFVPVIAVGSHVLWAAGRERISYSGRVGKESRMLMLCIYTEEV